VLSDVVNVPLHPLMHRARHDSAIPRVAVFFSAICHASEVPGTSLVSRRAIHSEPTCVAMLCSR
jgi:hypothetical protein